jgi:hypothetical protein
LQTTPSKHFCQYGNPKTTRRFPSRCHHFIKRFIHVNSTKFFNAAANPSHSHRLHFQTAANAECAKRNGKFHPTCAPNTTTSTIVWGFSIGQHHHNVGHILLCFTKTTTATIDEVWKTLKKQREEKSNQNYF